MKKIAIISNISSHFDYHIIAHILEIYNYNCKLYIYHDLDDVSNSVVYRYLSYLEENISFHCVRTLSQSIDIIMLDYIKINFDYTIYLYHMHKTMNDNMNIWYDYCIQSFYNICKIINKYQNICKKLHKFIYFSNDLESYSSLNFKRDICNELYINAYHIQYQYEVIYENDYYQRQFDITKCKNRIKDLIDLFYRGEKYYFENDKFLDITLFTDIMKSLEDIINKINSNDPPCSEIMNHCIVNNYTNLSVKKSLIPYIFNSIELNAKDSVLKSYIKRESESYYEKLNDEIIKIQKKEISDYIDIYICRKFNMN